MIYLVLALGIALVCGLWGYLQLSNAKASTDHPCPQKKDKCSGCKP